MSVLWCRPPQVSLYSMIWLFDSDQGLYHVYFGVSLPPTNRIASVWSPSCDPGSLSMGTRYYWQVVASNGVGMTTGPVWTFTTESLAITPTNGLDSSGHRGVRSVRATSSISWRI